MEYRGSDRDTRRHKKVTVATAFSAVLASRGIAHHLEDWPKGRHDWLYWQHQMWEYVGQHY